MLYPIGQALFYVIVVLIALAVLAIPLARWAGRLKTHIANWQHAIYDAFEEGKKEDQ
jgi:hypothetical protein